MRILLSFRSGDQEYLVFYLNHFIYPIVGYLYTISKNNIKQVRSYQKTPILSDKSSLLKYSKSNLKINVIA